MEEMKMWLEIRRDGGEIYEQLTQFVWKKDNNKDEYREQKSVFEFFLK